MLRFLFGTQSPKSLLAAEAALLARMAALVTNADHAEEACKTAISTLAEDLGTIQALRKRLIN